MNLLLDTHIWLWTVLEPARITPAAAIVLENPENELWLSPISIWEVMVLWRKKRLQLEPYAEEWVRRRLRERPMREAAITREVAIQSERITLPHADPADRFIAASAIVLDLVLVTSDEHLIDCTAVPTLSNR